MATSMQFGPEWMRKAPAKNSAPPNGSQSAAQNSVSPSRNEAPGPVAPSSQTSAGKRNPSLGNLASLNGPAPVTSPTISSPGAFSFAAAAGGGATSAISDRPHQTSTQLPSGGDGDLNSVVKDPNQKYSREKLLSLYSNDRGPKTSLDSPSDNNSVGGGSIAPKKKSVSLGTEKEPPRRTTTAADHLGSNGPLSPSLGNSSHGEPRGLNARSSSGGPAAGLALGGNWDKTDKDRPGLFQRASAGSLSGVASNSRPLSPSTPRDRFGGIQGGVLSGVAPPRKRMDSESGAADAVAKAPRTPRAGPDEPLTPAVPGGGSWSRPGNIASDAFGTGRLRSKPANDGLGLSGSSQANSATGVSAESGNQPEGGGSLSARFGRIRERNPGEGPIGPPSDGSVGFHKFSGYDRKRERQASQARTVSNPSEAGAKSVESDDNAKAAAPVNDDAHTEKPSVDEAREAPDDTSRPSRDEVDLSQHATSVLGSLKLDDDEVGGVPAETFPSSTDGGEATSKDPVPPPAPWSPETAFWLYRDPSGQVQGPFSALSMQDWYRQSYFTDDLLVKRQEDAEFRPLAQVVASIGDIMQPFLVPPRASSLMPDVGTLQGLGQDANVPRENSSLQLGSDAHGEPEAVDVSRFGFPLDTIRDAGTGRVWNADARQWSSQFDVGFGAAGGPPLSPFVNSQNIFSGQTTLDCRLRTQEEFLALIRERELQEQRHAAAAAAARGQAPTLGFGQADPFGGLSGRPGALGWETHGSWMGQPRLPTHFEPAFGGPGGVLTSESAMFDAFGQGRGADQALSSAWPKDPSTPARSQFENPANFGRPGQWEQAPWGSASMTPETVHRHLQDLQDGSQRRESNTHRGDPIGTPRRARSPAPVEQEARPPSENRTENLDAAAQDPSVIKESPVVNGDASEDTNAIDAVAHEVAPQKVEESKGAEEPGPEQIWPQSPKAVEFAPISESTEAVPKPDPKKSTNEAQGDTKNTTPRKVIQRQPSQVSQATVPSAKAPEPSTAKSVFAAGSVKVVSQDQFRRGTNESTSLGQAPLSAWLPDSGPETPGSATAKPAPWAPREDDPAPSTPGPSLREIQEAEVKRAEARRAAEKAAAAAQRAKAAASATISDDLPTSMSWGLASVPASKAIATATDNTSPAPGLPAAPAWNASKAGSTPKKTLTEIQEEERRRAQKQKEQQAAQAMALRRGYAESAVRTAAVPAASAVAGGAWSVVGSGGKPANPPSVNPVTQTPSIVSRPGLSQANQRTSSLNLVSGSSSPAWATPAAKTSAPASPAVQRASSQPVPAPISSMIKSKPPQSASAALINTSTDSNGPAQPSPEFIRYCKENLKGLNVKADDFIEMLLSFPLDPSPDVIEIIAESVYANSSTLDGRRFAADFVAKRKMDAQGRGQVNPASGKWAAAGGASSALGGVRGGGLNSGARVAGDILKAQSPTKTADALGGFKVVKAKGSKKRVN
ncbi:hypothetical protein IE53DRAFT_366017 [Violaceomyces palustris]|uniref:Uncharacterized protein n=1 Tax=Violaceomyces palustris TaxID=1673888 RepID=A0ACD0P789_9BASI|nr:hypothetical protein IE53DRAFT_366017 [Violaceomyces palustris]